MCRFVRASALSIVVFLSPSRTETSVAQEQTAMGSRDVVSPGGDSNSADERQTSDWGELVNGLRMRASCPSRIEQGETLTCDVEFQCVVSELRPGIKAFNPCYATCTHFRLLLTEIETEEITGIDAETQTHGTPFDDGRFARALDGSPIEMSHPGFATLIEGKPLPPGRYQAVVRYRQPPDPNPGWLGGRADWDAREFWSGKTESVAVEIEIIGAVERAQTIYVPERVKVMRRYSWPLLHPPEPPRVRPDYYFLVTYLFDDAEAVVVPRRNGHWIGHTADSPVGGLGFQGGAPMPGDVNGLEQLHEFQYRGGDLDYTLTVTVFESCDRTSWPFPGPGSCGYKVLWEKSFPVKYTAEEMAAAPEFPWYGPP